MTGVVFSSVSFPLAKLGEDICKLQKTPKAVQAEDTATQELMEKLNGRKQKLYEQMADELYSEPTEHGPFEELEDTTLTPKQRGGRPRWGGGGVRPGLLTPSLPLKSSQPVPPYLALLDPDAPPSDVAQSLPEKRITGAAPFSTAVERRQPTQSALSSRFGRKLNVTASLQWGGMPDDLSKSQPSDCKATMREVLKYAWNYASGRFRPKEGGAVNESSVQQEFSWQLELDSNDKWISFGGKNSYAMPSSLGSDVLTKFAKKVIPEGNEPVELPLRRESLWYLEMEGKDLSMALSRDFTIHHISLPGMSVPWQGMTTTITALTTLKRNHTQNKPRFPKGVFKLAVAGYLEAICSGSSRSHGEPSGSTDRASPFLDEEIHRKCARNHETIPLAIKIFAPGALREEEPAIFEVPKTSPLAKSMDILELFARKHKPPPPVPKKTRVYRRENQQSGDPPPKPFLPADFRLPVDPSTPTSEADTASPPSSPVSPNGVQVMNRQNEELMKKLKAREQKLTEQLGEDAEEQSTQPTEREQPDERDGRALPPKQGRKPNWDDIEARSVRALVLYDLRLPVIVFALLFGIEIATLRAEFLYSLRLLMIIVNGNSKNGLSRRRYTCHSLEEELPLCNEPAGPGVLSTGPPFAGDRIIDADAFLQGFTCRVLHAFTTAADEKVLYELALKGDDIKLYYNVLEGDDGPTERKIPTTTSLKRGGMPDDLPKSQPSDCKATMREVLKYAWNYASGRFRPKEGGAVNESPVQQEFSWQLELDSNDKWISFGGKNSYAITPSLGSDVLTKFAKKVFPEKKGEPLKLPDTPESLWYLEMEGKDLSMALNRDFTIHRIRLPGMPIRWKGMTAAISELSGIKGDHAQEEPKTSEDIAKNAFGSYLEAICLEGSRSSEGTFNGETVTVWPFGKEIYDKCNKNNIPIPIPAIIFEPGAVRQSRENAFQVSARSRLAKAMEVLELFARRHVVN
ncbi:hypothetical protein FOZ60_016289 [Perkinsus olseni]|uniref:Uncharacterized protein n=1 Tax=Perkinsus olseni TaxID=32597 RepID=A0A7J6P5C7_PEROL|nr:hypothetical protein FOZ60_016289 [Perkinsus olseni]